jgi:bacterioferritin-associated ferredoxin
MYVCICHGVTDRAIREASARGIATVDQLGAETGCGCTCGACLPLAAELLGCEGRSERHGRGYSPMPLAVA